MTSCRNEIVVGCHRVPLSDRDCDHSSRYTINAFDIIYIAGAASATRRESLYSGSAAGSVGVGANATGTGARRGADDSGVGGVGGGAGAGGAAFGACGTYGRAHAPLYRAPHTPPHSHDHY